MDSSNQKQKCYINKRLVRKHFNKFNFNKRKTSLIETDRRPEFYNNIFQNLLNKDNIKQ